MEDSKATIAGQSASVEEKAQSSVLHVDGTGPPLVLSSDVDSSKVWNPLLIASCVSFGAASMLFGYDDKVISPVAAMERFVSDLRSKRLDPKS